jgi:hypothetical protein
VITFGAVVGRLPAARVSRVAPLIMVDTPLTKRYLDEKSKALGRLVPEEVRGQPAAGIAKP